MPPDSPKCPKCGYDLTGTLAAERTICPECGVDFEVSRMRSVEVREDLWNTARGVQQIVLAMAMRAVVSILVLAAAFFVLIPALASPPYWKIVLLLSVTGIGLGVAIMWELPLPTRGFRLMMACLALVAAWCCPFVAAGLASALRPAGWLGVMVLVAPTAAFATLWIARDVLLPE